MEGRGAAARPGWHHESRRLYRKIGSSGQQARAYSHIHEREREREKSRGGRGGGDKPVEKGSERILLSVVDLSSTRKDECTEVEELLRRKLAVEAEESNQKGGWGKPPLERVIWNNDEEEDGIHGGRMKPLASFDVNRGLPPSQQGRKLRIKLSPPGDNSAPTVDGAAGKAIRRAQDKENGGLVPLCPGTTQIRCLKRKIVSPTDLKPQGIKRARPPVGSDNATDRTRKGLAESSAPSSVAETERDEKNGMDLLLMALKAADPKCQRSISPSLPLARPKHVQATNGEKALENARTTTKVGATMAHLNHPQAQYSWLQVFHQDASSFPGGVNLDRLNKAQNGAQFSANGRYSCYLPRSYSGLPKAPSLTTRQKRGRKKLLKEMLKNIPAKTTSTASIFKPLSEPSGLLGDFNPGIFRQRVRNSEQIHAVLGALIRAPSLPKVPQNSARVAAVTTEGEGELNINLVPVQETLKKKEKYLSQAETSEIHCLTVELKIESEHAPQVHNTDPQEELLDQGQPLVLEAEEPEPLLVTSKIHQGLPEPAGLVSLTDEVANADCLHEQSESFTQGVSSISGDPEFAEDNEQDPQPMSGTDCSPAAAGLAGRWLELLTLDIKGRLSALKQSRLRVQKTLMSGELNPESGSASILSLPPSTKSSIDMHPHGSQQSMCSDASPPQATGDESSQHVDRWRALFTNMDGVLGNEEAKLESWLWQIQQMQAFCPTSNQQPFSAPEKSHAAFCQGPATSYPGIVKQLPQRWPLTIEAIEKELGFAASAASIMSTANFLTKVQSFS